MDQTDLTRRRRFHRRSRNGCLTCRARHIRCDQVRPAWYSCPFPMIFGSLTLNSIKCSNSGNICSYPEFQLSVEEQTWGSSKIPGVVIWHISNTHIDPFETLPIQMPYKSQELLRYCMRSYPGSNNMDGRLMTFHLIVIGVKSSLDTHDERDRVSAAFTLSCTTSSHLGEDW